MDVQQDMHMFPEISLNNKAGWGRRRTGEADRYLIKGCSILWGASLPTQPSTRDAIFSPEIVSYGFHWRPDFRELDKLLLSGLVKSCGYFYKHGLKHDTPVNISQLTSEALAVGCGIIINCRQVSETCSAPDVRVCFNPADCDNAEHARTPFRRDKTRNRRLV